MKPATKLIIEEVAVLFASVLIFRSCWTLLDHVPLFNEDVALWIMLAAGVVIMVAAMHLLNKKNEGKK